MKKFKISTIVCIICLGTFAYAVTPTGSPKGARKGVAKQSPNRFSPRVQNPNGLKPIPAPKPMRDRLPSRLAPLPPLMPSTSSGLSSLPSGGARPKTNIKNQAASGSSAPIYGNVPVKVKKAVEKKVPVYANIQRSPSISSTASVESLPPTVPPRLESKGLSPKAKKGFPVKGFPAKRFPATRFRAKKDTSLASSSLLSVSTSALASASISDNALSNKKKIGKTIKRGRLTVQRDQQALNDFLGVEVDHNYFSENEQRNGSERPDSSGNQLTSLRRDTADAIKHIKDKKEEGPETVKSRKGQPGPETYTVKFNGKKVKYAQNFSKYKDITYNVESAVNSKYQVNANLVHTTAKTKNKNKTKIYGAQFPYNASADTANNIPNFLNMLSDNEISKVVVLVEPKELSRVVFNELGEPRVKNQESYFKAGKRTYTDKAGKSITVTSTLVETNKLGNARTPVTVDKYKLTFNDVGGRSRSIQLDHVSNWIDKQPVTPSQLFDMVKGTISTQDSSSHSTEVNTLVHCSAGVGRTGTLIAAKIMHDQYKTGKKVDARKTIANVREERSLHAVQTKEQEILLVNFQDLLNNKAN